MRSIVIDSTIVALGCSKRKPSTRGNSALGFAIFVGMAKTTTKKKKQSVLHETKGVNQFYKS